MLVGSKPHVFFPPHVFLPLAGSNAGRMESRPNAIKAEFNRQYAILPPPKASGMPSEASQLRSKTSKIKSKASKMKSKVFKVKSKASKMKSKAL